MIGVDLVFSMGELQRSENPGWRGVPLYARRGGFLGWGGALGVRRGLGGIYKRSLIAHCHLMASGKEAVNMTSTWHPRFAQ